jgi:hypothetical protein
MDEGCHRNVLVLFKTADTARDLHLLHMKLVITLEINEISVFQAMSIAWFTIGSNVISEF